VLGVDVRAVNAGDGEGAAPLLVEAQGVEGVKVDTLLGDMAYSDGDATPQPAYGVPFVDRSAAAVSTAARGTGSLGRLFQRCREVNGVDLRPSFHKGLERSGACRP